MPFSVVVPVGLLFLVDNLEHEVGFQLDLLVVCVLVIFVVKLPIVLAYY